MCFSNGGGAPSDDSFKVRKQDVDGTMKFSKVTGYRRGSDILFTKRIKDKEQESSNSSKGGDKLDVPG